ncbi:hypothetical protein AJ78_03097 [Emergomyces pasteurianus Ep9510]|uniref:Uncharacterized protein n=1 Tax=Emergomyces pasteurianus Ep9510 TaxID=1447872 RepID=A0A1J9QKP9_9EURO|nr:hypothetical protein AJ78_03097 [Emergomyces pasteurianus Ep9510]
MTTRGNEPLSQEANGKTGSQQPGNFINDLQRLQIESHKGKAKDIVSVDGIHERCEQEDPKSLTLSSQPPLASSPPEM